MNTRKSSLFPIFFVIFMDNFGFAMLFSILGPLFLLPDYGMVSAAMSVGTRNVLLAIVYGVFPLTQFFGSPLIGDFADHFGRKKALYITIGGVTIGYFLSALAIGIHSVTLLVISRVLSGFFAGNLSISLAAIADMSPDEKSRGRNFSHVTTLFGFSWIFAMMIGGYLANPKIAGEIGPVIAFLITGGLSMLNYVAIWFFFHETHTEGQDFTFDIFRGIKNVSQVFHLKGVRVLFLVYFLWVIGWGMSIQWYPPYSIEMYHSSVTDVTSWMIVLGITWILGSSIVNFWLLRRYNSLSIANIGIICTTFLVFIAQLMTQHGLFSLFYSLAAIFSAFTMSNTINLISMSAPADVQGKTMGLSQSTMSLGWIVSSIVAAVLNRSDIGFMYIFCAIMLFLAFLLLGWLYLHRRRSQTH